MSRLSQDTRERLALWKTAVLGNGKGKPAEAWPGGFHIKLAKQDVYLKR